MKELGLQDKKYLLFCFTVVLIFIPLYWARNILPAWESLSISFTAVASVYYIRISGSNSMLLKNIFLLLLFSALFTSAVQYCQFSTKIYYKIFLFIAGLYAPFVAIIIFMSIFNFFLKKSEI
jgi:hypothetical protein